MTSELLHIEGLRVAAQTAGDVKIIVNDVGLTLNRGEVLGLIGESGAGKSTIGLSAMGYARPVCTITHGEIRFQTADLRSMTLAQRRRLRGQQIAYVAQSAAASFNPAKRLMRQICESPVLHGSMTYAEAAQQAVAMFRKVGLPSPESFGERYPHEVSGGQLQRAMTVMAMLSRPKLLILDEPTTALDVTTQIEVLKEIKSLIRESGTAALYISHDLAIVAQLSDRILVLRDGQRVEEGATEDILERPSAAYTKELLSARNFLPSSPGPRSGTLEPLLELRNVSARYARSGNVVDDVDLVVHKGCTTAIVGESGSGKTTLGRVIAGLIPSSTGKLLFRGDPLPPLLRKRSRDSLRRIQFVQQMPDTALNPRHTVRDIIGRPLEFYWNLTEPKRSERVIELLRSTELSETLLDRKPDQLSGGQKQRVCIARALAAEPDLIICDEVTSALDPLVAKGVIELLQRLQRNHGYSYIFISHDLGIVRQIADRVAIMLKGRFIAEGPSEAVFSPPFHPYTERLLKSVPEMRRHWLDETTAANASPA
jgi:peptide/nickel transport system ATP-binding protein